MAWAIRHRTVNRLDGKRVWLEGTTEHPCRTVLFETRDEARAHIRENWGYIATRPDLRAEPHGWRMPTPVKVWVKFEEAS
jgi:hypothetical protein